MVTSFLKKYYYGDIPDEKGGSDLKESRNTLSGSQAERSEGTKFGGGGHDWPLWEVFIRSKNGLDHKHAGSLHAADAQMAIENARDVYTRRMEGISIWVVESKHIIASNPEEAGELYEPAIDKIYRHPTFYELPDEVNHM
ncbi:MAG TPA: 1,2-phenylacetyl-CoA epoxidase subunit PaaB [Chitinophagaceae bacterium]|nr:1,2-phenylacetyl-CoA epoxidase subunit PaaB [Chitinophagaceae bacterium]